jgi:hypothetical protein
VTSPDGIDTIDPIFGAGSGVVDAESLAPPSWTQNPEQNKVKTNIL